MLIIWYINIQVTSSSQSCGHVDIQVRSNVVLGIYIHMQVFRINFYACKYVHRQLNYETVGLHHKYTGI
jgi:hypothetical protein